MPNDKELIKTMLDALMLAQGVAMQAISETGFDESRVSDWRPQVEQAASQAMERLKKS